MFGKTTGYFASALMIPIYLIWTAVQLLEIGKILNVLFDINFIVGYLLATCIVIYFTFIRGLIAVVWTDAKQIILKLLMHYHMSTVPVINGLDTRFHPTQMLADLFTIREHIKDGRKLSDLTLAFMGDASDVCRSLLLTCTKYGMNFKQIGPVKYLVQATKSLIILMLLKCVMSFMVIVSTE